jgi:hypothetical protein
VKTVVARATGALGLAGFLVLALAVYLLRRAARKARGRESR